MVPAGAAQAWAPAAADGCQQEGDADTRDMQDTGCRAGIVAIGDELVLGRLVDTNSAHIARWCSDHGLQVAGMTTVPDESEAITAALRRFAAGCRLVIVTGGLGPTADDLTREALAAALRTELVFDEECWRQIEDIYARLRPDATVPASNRRQAWLPRGTRPLVNDRGTAPGILAELDACRVACLPGVPHEMRAMLERLDIELESVLPGRRPPTVAEVWFSGLGESRAADRLGDLLRNDACRVGITAHGEGHMTVRIVGDKPVVDERAEAVRSCMADHLLPADGLAPSLVAVCRERGLTISGAESCTCGRIVDAVGAVPGASAVLREWLIAYHDEVKRERLGVTVEDLREHGAVSEPVAAQMARGMQARTGADLVLATSGIAGPGGGSPAKPVGTVWIGLASALGGGSDDGPAVTTRLLTIPGDRLRVQSRAAAAALQLAYTAVRP